MSVLSDAKLREIYNEACKPHQTVMAAIHAGLRAVAEAAIAADRAARAEQSARLQAMGMSAGAASDYVEFVSHRQHCAIRHGLDACTCDYAKAAAPAPSQEPKQ